MAIDGKFDEWRPGDIVLNDPIDAGSTSVDIRSLSVATEGTNLFFLIRLQNQVNLQMLDGTLSLLLDLDDDSLTGGVYDDFRGVDLIFDMSPPKITAGGIIRMGMACRSVSTTPSGDNAEETANLYDYDILVAPTFSSDTFELSLAAGERNNIRGRLVFTDKSGREADRTDVFHYRAKGSNSGMRLMPGPLSRSSGTDLRVVSWNVADRSILHNVGAFQKIFRTLKPDILLLDEVTGRMTRGDMEEIINGSFSSSENKFTAVLGNGGGYQRGAVAVRSPLTLEPVFDFLQYPKDQMGGYLESIRKSSRRVHQLNRLDDGLAATAAVVGFNGKRILCVAVDLESRGRFDSPEDKKRIAEARIIRSAIEEKLSQNHYDAVLLAGDFNLVGSRLPLDILCGTGTETVGQLVPVEAYQLDRLSNFTWYNSRDIFPPGRLDYMLHSPKLFVRRSFVFNSFKLSQKLLNEYGLSGRESEQTSDHLPIVADLSWED